MDSPETQRRRAALAELKAFQSSLSSAGQGRPSVQQTLSFPEPRQARGAHSGLGLSSVSDVHAVHAPSVQVREEAVHWRCLVHLALVFPAPSTQGASAAVDFLPVRPLRAGMSATQCTLTVHAPVDAPPCRSDLHQCPALGAH